MQETIRRLWSGLIVAAFFWCAKRIFAAEVKWTPHNEDNPTAVLYGRSECDLNCAARDYVEHLDTTNER